VVMRKMLLLVFLVLGIVFLSGCVQQQEAGNITNTNNTTPNNSGVSSNKSAVVYYNGSFSLQVLKCLDDKLLIKNNGTGTVLLNTSTLVQSRGGILTYGTIKGENILQPGEVKTIELTRNISKSGLYRFRLNTVMKTSTGNNYVMTYFECSE